ncbi:hypothetical protein A9Q84_11545 [Halobacteriovorax marinus]|mgnify:CR=1 FL=1|uniref:PilZ domain-containing protein n=1 Tax=Halobacteriovorax marinus TaxID=97084 RepID=A0A1Y5F7V2_9BACT|nr:hypothetical protein A9Q84_11545 [Halobacteriovorax marinus]
MKKKDANKKHYFSIVETDKVHSVLTCCAKDGLTAYLWDQGHKESELEEYEIAGFENSKKLILKSKGGFLSKLSKSKLTDKQIYIKFNYDKFQYFTYGVLNYNKEEKSYFINIIREVYSSQQRTNYRLNANNFVKIQFKLEDEVYDAHDISAGGTSFSLPEAEKDKYPEGQIFKSCMLRLNKDKFEIPEVKVAKIWPDKDAGGNLNGIFKVGIAFIDVPKRVEEDLFISINGAARAEEVRKTMKQKKLANQ